MRGLKLALTILAVLAGAAGAVAVLPAQAGKQFVRPPAGQNPPYSLGITAGGTVYVAGMLPTDEKGNLVQGDITAQTKQVFENIRSVLKQANSSIDQVVTATVMLQRAEDFAAMDQVYRQQFKGEPPARTTIMGDMVRPGALIEIQVTAVPNGAERRAILPPGWMKPTSPYNYAIQSGDTLYLSGLVSRSGRDNKVIEGDIATQVKTIMENAGEILKAAGMSLNDTVTSRVALRDIANFDEMNKVYRTYWEADRPTRATVQAGLPGTFGVEITFVAIRGASPREIIIPPTADGKPGQAGPNFSPAIRVGNRLFVSGGTGSTEANRGDMRAQTVETLARLGRSLRAAGFDYKDVVSSEVWITDVQRFNEMNEGYRPTFPSDPPVRATIGIPALAGREALVEVAFTAVK
jgi:2-iminobutanoate/2-iminopropanoate deaminase